MSECLKRFENLVCHLNQFHQGVCSYGEPYKCVDCGKPMNEGEIKTFTCCDDCWNLVYKSKPLTTAQEVSLIEREQKREKCDLDRCSGTWECDHCFQVWVNNLTPKFRSRLLDYDKVEKERDEIKTRHESYIQQNVEIKRMLIAERDELARKYREAMELAEELMYGWHEDSDSGRERELAKQYRERYEALKK